MLYRVTSPIKMNHVDYRIGSEIELDDVLAAKIGHSVEGPIAPVKLGIPPEEIAGVIEVLRGDTDLAVFEPLPEITEEVVCDPRKSKPITRRDRKGGK